MPNDDEMFEPTPEPEPEPEPPPPDPDHADEDVEDGEDVKDNELPPDAI